MLKLRRHSVCVPKGEKESVLIASLKPSILEIIRALSRAANCGKWNVLLAFLSRDLILGWFIDGVSRTMVPGHSSSSRCVLRDVGSLSLCHTLCQSPVKVRFCYGPN